MARRLEITFTADGGGGILEKLVLKCIGSIFFHHVGLAAVIPVQARRHRPQRDKLLPQIDL